MPTHTDLLSWLHVGLTLAMTVLAGVRLYRPESRADARGLEVAAALLAAAALPLAAAFGWWVDMPARKVVPPVGSLALVVGISGMERLAGRLASLALAAFFLVLGIVSLRNGGPLTGVTAGKAMLLGLGLALLPWRGAVRLRMGLLLILLAAGTVPGVLRGIPAA